MPVDSDYINEIVRLVRDTSNRLEVPTDYAACLGRALERYSIDRPPLTGTLHTVTESASTVYEGDFYSVCSLAAGHACGLLASEFIPSVDKNPQADFAGLQSKVDHYRSRRRDFFDDYLKHMKIVGVESDFIFGEVELDWIEGAETAEL